MASRTASEHAIYIVNTLSSNESITTDTRLRLIQMIERAIHLYSPAAARMAECEQLARCLLTRLADIAETGDAQSEQLLRRGRLFFAELADR